MECTSEYTNWDLRSEEEFIAWRLSQGSHSLACSKYPYCSHYGGAFYNPIPPYLRREEAWHSDIPKGMARALEDGQLPIIVYRHAALTFRDRDNDWKRPWQGEERTPPRHLRWGRARNFTPWARMFRHPKLTGQDTKQETLSSID